MYHPVDQFDLWVTHFADHLLVGRGCKGNLSERLHMDVISHLRAILPQNFRAVFLEMKNSMVLLQEPLLSLGFCYVCRTAKNTQLYEDDMLFLFGDLCLRPGDQISIPNVCFTHEGYGPLMVIAWWIRGYHEPIFLLTYFELCGEACYGYQKRFLNESLPFPVSFTLLDSKSAR